MNTKTLITSLAFGLVSANAVAVEAMRVDVPVASLERAEIRAQISRSDTVGAFFADEAYGSFAYRTLHGRSGLSRADVVAEMAMPKWQALIAARSDTYNSYGRAAIPGTSLATLPSEVRFAARIDRLDFVGG